MLTLFWWSTYLLNQIRSESYRLEKQRIMNESNSSLDLDDKNIDLSDIPELDADKFAQAIPTAQFLAEQGISYVADGPHQITIQLENGGEQQIELKTNRVIVLDPDVSQYFKDSQAVNMVLRKIIELMSPQRR